MWGSTCYNMLLVFLSLMCSTYMYILIAHYLCRTLTHILLWSNFTNCSRRDQLLLYHMWLPCRPCGGLQEWRTQEITIRLQKLVRKKALFPWCTCSCEGLKCTCVMCSSIGCSEKVCITCTYSSFTRLLLTHWMQECTVYMYGLAGYFIGMGERNCISTLLKVHPCCMTCLDF